MATYYFSTSGDNTTGDGSVGNPWQNFNGKKDGVGALSAGDICLFKAGDIWYGANAELECLSSGTDGNPIVFDRYGDNSLPDPIFCGATITTGWTFFATSSHSGGGSIYSKSGTTYPYTVGVDGTYALVRTDAVKTAIQKGSFRRESGITYINLKDGDNPSGHDIYVPYTTFSYGYAGAINAGFRFSTVQKSNGNYVEFNHLQSWYNNRVGFSSSGTKVRFNDCYALGNAYEGFLFRRDVNQDGLTTGSSCDAQYTQAHRCLATYNNANGSGYGQAYTTLASYTWWVDCIAINNAMAGFDFLDFGNRSLADPSHMGTSVRYSGMVNCKSGYNGQTRGTTAYDPSTYVDGASDILIYGCHFFGAGVGNQASYAVPVLYINAEHATDRGKYVNNVYVINNLIYDGNYDIVRINGDMNNLGGKCSGLEIINNTIIKSNSLSGTGTNSTPGALSFENLETGGVRMRNNIIYRTTGNNSSTMRRMWSTTVGTDAAYIDSDYNLIWNAVNTNIFDYGGFKTFANWQASPFSQDANGVSSDPSKCIRRTVALSTSGSLLEIIVLSTEESVEFK